MTVRELVVLGTASQVPTRERNHNGYVLRWGGEAILFDPGEGSQRQLTLAGVSPTEISRICITHLHGDHCLGLPGVLQRLTLDGVTREIDLHYPASGAPYIDRLRNAIPHHETFDLRLHPEEAGTVVAGPPYALVARELRHRIDTLGWRVQEPAGRTILPERLAALGIEGPDIGRLQQEGRLAVGDRTVTLDEVSVHRPGQVFAFVMDTAYCDAAVELAADADLLVCEATFLNEHADLAERFGHLTAAQAARIAAEAGAGTLVLTHFSQRYQDPGAYLTEAKAVFDDVVIANDLDRILLPPRRPSPQS